jgi:phosphate transport system substrate-binding protein
MLLLAACGTPATHHTKQPKKTSTTLPASNPSSTVTLTEAGSSLLYPYLQLLAPQLHAAFSNISLEPAAGGSGLGIADTIAKLTNLGGSDAYLSAANALANPGVLNIPIAVSSQAIDYNVAGAPAYLKLDGKVVAEIYQGSITNWDDPQIAALNTGVTLPNLRIIPVRRADSSGDTFIFTSFLSATDKTWANGPSEGTTVTWPAVSDELSATGNPAMITVCKATPGCIAYIGISAENTAIESGLQEALLQNKAGNFLKPIQATMTAAALAGASATPASLTQSLIYEPGAQSYPIVNFEYVMVQAQQTSSATAEAIRAFYTWAISSTGGATPNNLAADNFVALPAVVVPKVTTAIQQIVG